MKRAFLSGVSCLLCVLLIFFLGGCKKRAALVVDAPEAVPSAPVVSKAPPSSPTIELSAEPGTIERGDQTTLKWKSQNASSVLIDGGVGTVTENGSVVLSPAESTTYTATATGSGGSARDSTRITVVGRSDRVISATDIEGLQRAIDEGRIRPVFFKYDLARLSADSQQVLNENARWIKKFPTATVIIEGHCDERGSEEYNLALGDRRSQATREYLQDIGVRGGQLEALSFGEERPFENCHDETCWQKNRRAHFVVKR